MINIINNYQVATLFLALIFFIISKYNTSILISGSWLLWQDAKKNRVNDMNISDTPKSIRFFMTGIITSINQNSSLRFTKV
jgi:hypothetical protein